MNTSDGMGSVPIKARSNFEILAAINVNEHTEKKGNLTYLSWAWAVDQLLRVDPSATWEYSEPIMFGQTMMVWCTVTAFGKAMKMQLPVMDHRNKPIPEPDAFQINTAMQRCLVKAIALHGLGLYIYAGEDLPEAEPKGVVAAVIATTPEPEMTDDAKIADREYYETLAHDVTQTYNKLGPVKALFRVGLENLDNDQKVKLWSYLDSKVRSGLKQASELERAEKAKA